MAVLPLAGSSVCRVSLRGRRHRLPLTPRTLWRQWPRNGRLGDLVEQPQWRAGYAELAAAGLGFDLQCNPWQLAEYVRAVVAPNPAVPCVLNHLGLPLLADLAEPERAAVFWDGMTTLAACPHGALLLCSPASLPRACTS